MNVFLAFSEDNALGKSAYLNLCLISSDNQWPRYSQSKLLAPVVQRLDNAIHRINHYPADSVVCFVNTYPPDSDLSGG